MGEARAGTERFDLVVAAERTIPQEIARVYALLADLPRHWPLLGDDLIRAELTGAAGTDADLLLRGPLPGLRRRVRTQVTRAEPEHAFGGIATAGESSAAIDWRLFEGEAGTTRVSVTVGVDAVGFFDRTLVFAARPWLAARCRSVLGRLETELQGER